MINKIIDEAREIISRYCVDECKAYCCRKGTIPLNDKSLKLISKYGDVKLIDYKTHESMILACLALKNNMCLIHNEKDRPSICKDFPIHMKDGVVIIHEGCHAIIDGRLYPFIREMKQKDIKIEYG